jgi:hypothetical protein
MAWTMGRDVRSSICGLLFAARVTDKVTAMSLDFAIVSEDDVVAITAYFDQSSDGLEMKPQPSPCDSKFNRKTGVVELRNCNGLIAKYQLTKAGKIEPLA